MSEEMQQNSNNEEDWKNVKYAEFNCNYVCNSYWQFDVLLLLNQIG